MNQNLKQLRKSHHLKLNDLAYIINQDQGNLSSFESGKQSNSKALLAYHTLFNLSTQNTLSQVFSGGSKLWLDRCFKLVEQIEAGPNTAANQMRLEGLHTLITNLMKLEGEDE